MTADPSEPQRAAPSPLAWATLALVFAVGVGVALIGAELAGVTNLLDDHPPAPRPAHPADPAEVPRLIAKGWDAASREDWTRAETLFRSALELDPEHDEATYGYGYVMLMEGRTAEATTHLCRARDAEERTIRREVAAMIESNALSCP